MDFAALMAKELGEPQKEQPQKYIRKSEVEARRVAAYEAEQKALAAEREAKAAAKRKREEEAADEDRRREEKRKRLAEESRRRREEREAEEERARRRRLGLPELTAAEEEAKKAAARKEEEEEEDLGGEDIGEEELLGKLRAAGEPAVLFGEGHAARVRRYRRLVGGVTKGPVPTTLEMVEEKDMKVSGVVPKDKEGRRWLFRQLGSYFVMVLTEYERAMAAEKTDTSASRAAHSVMVQCRENIKPLFRRFEKGELEDSILEPIVEIVKAAQERRYVDANDGYLRVSIGKAAWPIGVTMVGIHERSAREKLHGGERGHVMGDEATRKYLQSIKRCLTFAQVRWPPDDVRQLMG